MKYYVITFEQVHNDNGSIGEYVTKSDPMTEKQAKTAFYNKCAAVNSDLSDNGHTFMKIDMANSIGGIVKQDTLGAYVEQTGE